ncbi:MAG TPA: cofactor-independent phosphoglycerate mutase, partial [Deltaproteobacteria bacterium]|nr:cofactor-independent phosphoglycerate mutase [Deltaproteobacteria bacterium]
MKYVILLGDGMADYPEAELGGKTVVEAAHTPGMDRIAAEGTLGLIDTIPPGCTPGSDTANLSILGYDPVKCNAGRGALEAASMGVKLDPGDVAFRCNLVTLDDSRGPERIVMEDFTSGHIGSDEAALLIRDIDSELGSPDLFFRPGVGYRHLMIWKNGPGSLVTKPPHDIVGTAVADYLPAGERSDRLRELMEQSRKLLADHPVNRRRLSRGDKPANAIWLWGQGGLPPMQPLTLKYGVSGAMISAVDLLKGIGVCAGLEVLAVPGATGYIDTNYRGKAEEGLRWLERGDFLFLHVEAPDEMGHEGNMKGKIEAVEAFDREVVSVMLEGLDLKKYEYRVMV